MVKERFSVQRIVFVFMLIAVLLLTFLNVAKVEGWLIPKQSEIQTNNKIINLSDLSLEQKIAQMIIVHGGEWNLENWKKMQLGGIHQFAMKDASQFREIISEFQKDMNIPFLVTVDLEGCWNPFANFKNFTAVSDIESEEEAELVGAEEGLYLRELGFNLDFAPVVDLNDEIWGCRSFPGNQESIVNLASAYIRGMESEGITTTVKHYPGKTLVVRDPHKYIVSAIIDNEDIYPFQQLSDQNMARTIMVSHIISSGVVDSYGKPAVVSPEIIAELKHNFSGLVISDEINMLGLKNYYPTLDEMYIAVFSAGNDLVLNFNDDPNEIYRMIQIIKLAVEEGKIDEKQINASVKKILELKGFEVR